MERSKLDALQARLDNTKVGSNVHVSDNITSATLKSLEEQKAVRNANSENSVITKFVLSSKPLIDRCVDGEKAKGVITNKRWEAVMNSFKKKLGVTIDEQNQVSFANAQNASEAKAVYEMILAAKDNENFGIELNINAQAQGAVKGFVVKLADGTETVMSKKGMRDYVLHSTSGYVKASAEGSGVRVNYNTKLNNSPADSAIDVSKIQDVGQVAVLKIVDRKTMTSDISRVDYHKELTNTSLFATGPKSAISCKYYKDDKKDKVLTYRIPLEANLFVLEVNPAYKAALGEAKGLTKFDFNDTDAISKQYDELQRIISVAAASGINDDTFAEIRNKAAEMTTTDSSAAEEAFN